jgi:dihydrofolate reductase
MKKQIIVVAALSQNGVYAEGGKIPWHIPEDLKHFKALTEGHTVVMGRNTWESLPEKFCPLPNRDNIVITTDEARSEKYQGAGVATSVDRAILKAKTEKVFCIGGRYIWCDAMSIADEVWITVVKQDFLITEGITQTAKLLLTPGFIFGRNFKLEKIKKPQYPEKTDLPFEIYHWVSA